MGIPQKRPCSQMAWRCRCLWEGHLLLVLCLGIWHAQPAAASQQVQIAPPSTAPSRSASLLTPGGSYESPLSEDATLIVSGIVEAFMHRVQLLPGEKSCLEGGIGRLAGDLMGAGEDVVSVAKDFQAHRVEMMDIGAEAGSRLMSIVAVVQELIASCMKGDALAALKQTARHLGNVSYIKRHLIVNGVDIAHFLADAVVAFEDRHFHRFGEDIGGALRQVLLSKATGHGVLPEGMPDDQVIERATEGLMRGFFVRGSNVRITDAYASGPVDVDIDLHECITGNEDFFKVVWESSWHLIARLAANRTQHQQSKADSNATTPPTSLPSSLPPSATWISELATAVLGIPVVLERCGLNLQKAKMLWDAVKSIQHVQVEGDWPEERFRAQTVVENVAKAVSAWTAWDFEGFGFDLGSLLREVLLLIFPQLYWVDGSGHLRRSLEAATLEGAGRAIAAPTAVAMMKSALGQQRLTARALLGSVLLVLLVASFALHALVTVRQQGGGYALPGRSRREHRDVEVDGSLCVATPSPAIAARLAVAPPYST